MKNNETYIYLNGIQEVGGSIPPSSTKEIKGLQDLFL